MSLTAKSTLSLRKKDVQQQKQAGATYRRVVFAHKASAGETGINLTALVQPSEMAALGFTNPSTSDLLAANMLFYKKNLTIISSARGTLMQDLSYTVPTSSRIEFQGFTALQDEIFTCLLETGVRDGLSIVDATPLIATGELAVGDTDFNVGVPFEVGKYSAQQIGSVLVFRNGAIQFRNPSNGTSGGNYQEIDNGSGLGTIIRFNNAPVGQSDNIIVWGNLLAERPDGSMMAAIESLAGQLDQMIPTLALLAGVDETEFQAQPNNQDLKSFGDKVQDHEQRIEDLESINSAIKFHFGTTNTATIGGLTNTAFASNVASTTITFVPNFTGRYKIQTPVSVQNGATLQRLQGRVALTGGTGTIVVQNDAQLISNVAQGEATLQASCVADLIAGVSVTFTLHTRISSGGSSYAATSGNADSGATMTAEYLGN